MVDHSMILRRDPQIESCYKSPRFHRNPSSVRSHQQNYSSKIDLAKFKFKSAIEIELQISGTRPSTFLQAIPPTENSTANIDFFELKLIYSTINPFCLTTFSFHHCIPAENAILSLMNISRRHKSSWTIQFLHNQNQRTFLSNYVFRFVYIFLVQKLVPTGREPCITCR